MPVPLIELGDQVRSAREDQSLTQEELTRLIGVSTNRSHLAHLEQGRRVPPNEVLEAICTTLRVPKKYWGPFTEPDYRRRLDFEEALSELVGRPVTLRFIDEQANAVADQAIRKFFMEGGDEGQIRDALNSVLVFYNVRQMSREFFSRYITADGAKSPLEFTRGVRRYQLEAIRLFSTFAEAYREMNAPGKLEELRSPLQSRDPDVFRRREAWDEIEQISEERLPDLGYISAKKARLENAERSALAAFLGELANQVEKKGKSAIDDFSEKKRRKMSSLLRKFESRLKHDFLSPLFTPDPPALRRESALLAPKGDEDLQQIEQTQAQAQRNLARYLAADHLDMYVATSMRTDADFVSVNRFVESLFTHPDVKPLNLRYFNPTQSWIDDRVAKGLVEALMLRRAAITIYMAQKTDTFGKDSEASVALGQGKPVVVYVPKLDYHAAQVDSEAIGAMARGDLEAAIAAEGGAEDKESDPTIDQDALVSRLLTIRLSRLGASAFPGLIRKHWADFDLYGEDHRIDDLKERESYRAWLDAVVRQNQSAGLPPELREAVIGILVATTVRFEARARVFREVHPLALQVILSTGVLNGILVARSIDACAKLVESLIRNQLSFKFVPEDDNYRLIETSTGSTARVISRHTLITNAFAAFYSDRSSS